MLLLAKNYSNAFELVKVTYKILKLRTTATQHGSVKRKENKTNGTYLPQWAGGFHGENADMKAWQISNTTRKKLCQGQTEVVQENPADFPPATEDSLQPYHNQHNCSIWKRSSLSKIIVPQKTADGECVGDIHYSGPVLRGKTTELLKARTTLGKLKTLPNSLVDQKIARPQSVATLGFNTHSTHRTMTQQTVSQHWRTMVVNQVKDNHTRLSSKECNKCIHKKYKYIHKKVPLIFSQ